MNTVTIGDILQADILPAIGGAVRMVRFQGMEVLYTAPEYLGVRNARAGGIPVLFPFAGKTEGDCYVVDGKKYEMPPHGFLKDQELTVVQQDDRECTLSYTNSAQSRERYYPYDFELRLTYRVDETTLYTKAEVENRSSEAMPIAMGFHPYFKTGRKELVKLTMGLTDYLDYTRGGSPGRQCGQIAMQEVWDHVFYGASAGQAELEARPEGYRATLKMDPTFTAITLCTKFDGTSCVEPWQASPDAAHRADAGVKVAAGQTGVFWYAIEFARLAEER